MSNADQEVCFLSAARFLLNLGTPVPAWRQSTLEASSLISLFWPSQFIAICTSDGKLKKSLSFDAFHPLIFHLYPKAIPSSAKCIIESLMIYPQLPNASDRICFVFRLCFFTLKCQRCKHAASEHPKVLRQILLQADPRHWKPRTVHRIVDLFDSWFRLVSIKNWLKRHMLKTKL